MIGERNKPMHISDAIQAKWQGYSMINCWLNVIPEEKFSKCCDYYS